MTIPMALTDYELRPSHLKLRPSHCQITIRQPRTTCSHFAANVAPKAVIFVLDFARVPEIIFRQAEVNT